MKPTPILTTLGPDFYDAVEPATFPQSHLRYFNKDAAQILGLEHLSFPEIQNHFWRFKPFKSNIRQPLALRYHGHQFRHYNPELGDGRGFLIAQFSGQKKIFDLTTKGSGTTPYSRAGDGRLTLKGALREILATEMLESLGVNTSRTFSVFETGEEIERQDEPSPARGAVLTRMVHSSIRFGTFQRLEYLDHTQEMEKLLEYTLSNYFSDVRFRSNQSRSIVFLKAVMRKTADLAAQLMTAGFIHGVLNTDNMNVTGEVFDFGPYRFLPTYNPYFTAAYFDHTGLYCYGRQPESLLWGLEQLGKALKKIDPTMSVESILSEYTKEFKDQLKRHFFRRLNLIPRFDEFDDTLIERFYQMLTNQNLMFEQTYFDFFGGFERQGWKVSAQKDHYQNLEAQDFIETLKHYKVADVSVLMHPYFLERRPETLLIQDIEGIWQPIALQDNWAKFEEKLKSIRAFRGVYKAQSVSKYGDVF